MPWKKNSEPEQRWGLIQLVLRAQLGLAELCRGSGISRKTAYKWLARFKEQGRQGLRNQTRCAHDLHNRPTERWLQRLRRRRRRNPTWGAPKIHWALRRRFGRRGLPAAGAIGRWLKSWGLTRRRRARALKGPSLLRPTLTQARQSHEVWTVDFKGWFRTGDGTKVAPLTVRDLATRYILLFCLLPRQRVGAARLAFERGFGVYGLPLVIRVDHGSPFGATGALGLTRLSAWWIKLGLHVEFIEPGHPEQNGAHEPRHRVYKADTLQPVCATRHGQQPRTHHWCWKYNYARPHAALGMAVPGDFYHKSRRRMPGRLGHWKYSAKWLSRLVKGKGMLSLNGRSRFVGEAFEGERLGLKRVPPGKWEVYFGPKLVGEFHDADAGGIRAVLYREKKQR